MSVMVVGGCGYIGAHVVRVLQKRQEEVVVVDDLSYGDAARIGSARLVRMDVADAGNYGRLVEALDGVTAVIHFAARKQVGESIEKPAWYYQQNIGGLALVLQAMAEKGVDQMIFSSSAAVYGMPDVELVSEDIDKHPINPYGETKLFGETMMAACQRAYGLKWIGLRYFNVAGSGAKDLGDPAILNLIPMVFERLAAGRPPAIFGQDYPTPDGTCVRDYIHVQDLAEAHVQALEYLRATSGGGSGEASGAAAAGSAPGTAADPLEHHVFNVGTGQGNSVKEVIDMVHEVTGIDFIPEVGPRRAGDPPRLVADSSRIRQVMAPLKKGEEPASAHTHAHAHAHAFSHTRAPATASPLVTDWNRSRRGFSPARGARRQPFPRTVGVLRQRRLAGLYRSPGTAPRHPAGFHRRGHFRSPAPVKNPGNPGIQC